jgi:hypothetical protein
MPLHVVVVNVGVGIYLIVVGALLLGRRALKTMLTR